MTILAGARDGPFPPGAAVRGVRQLPYFHPHAVNALWHARRGHRHGAAARRSPRDLRHRHSGPLAGLVPTLLFCVIGLQLSTPTNIQAGPNSFSLGSSYLFATLGHWFAPQAPEANGLNLHRWQWPVGSAC